MCPVKVDLLSVTFDPETAEIRSVIVTPTLLRPLHCNNQSLVLLLFIHLLT